MMAALSDADCRSVMIPAPIALPRHATLATALRTLVELRLLSVPIVDDDGRYLGMLNRSRLIAQALPKIATLNEAHVPPAAQLLDVGFLPDTVADVRRRFAAIANEPVEKYCDRTTPVLRPETPLMNTLYFLYKSRNFLPVVDGTTGKLVGLVTTWQVLEVIGGLKS